MSGAEWAVTTEKDLVRLEGLNLKGLPIRVFGVRMAVSDEAVFQGALFTGLGIREDPPSNQEKA